MIVRRADLVIPTHGGSGFSIAPDFLNSSRAVESLRRAEAAAQRLHDLGGDVVGIVGPRGYAQRWYRNGGYEVPPVPPLSPEILPKLGVSGTRVANTQTPWWFCERAEHLLLTPRHHLHPNATNATDDARRRCAHGLLLGLTIP